MIYYTFKFLYLKLKEAIKLFVSQNKFYLVFIIQNINFNKITNNVCET